jgi:hypothetical protein
MKYPRTLPKTLAILGPMAIAVSSCATEPAQAQAYGWCSNYYDPSCAYPYAYPYAYDPYPYGNGFFFFGDGGRFDHHFDHHFHHHFDHRGFNHGGFGHGGMGHGGGGHGGGHGH